MTFLKNLYNFVVIKQNLFTFMLIDYYKDQIDIFSFEIGIISACSLFSSDSQGWELNLVDIRSWVCRFFR